MKLMPDKVRIRELAYSGNLYMAAEGDEDYNTRITRIVFKRSGEIIGNGKLVLNGRRVWNVASGSEDHQL